MATDGSLATKTEDWIVTQIQALSEFEDRHVQPFEGTISQAGKELVEEMTRYGTPAVRVLFEGDIPIPLQEGEQAYDPTYVILVIIQNERPEAARRGDGTKIGTNKVRDLLRTALHGKFPQQSASGYYTDHTEFRGCQVVFQRADAFILRATVVVRESPAAS